MSARRGAECGALKLSNHKYPLLLKEFVLLPDTNKSPKPFILENSRDIHVFRELQTRGIWEIHRVIKFTFEKNLVFIVSIRDFHGTKFSYFLKRIMKYENICMTKYGHK